MNTRVSAASGPSEYTGVCTPARVIVPVHWALTRQCLQLLLGFLCGKLCKTSSLKHGAWKIVVISVITAEIKKISKETKTPLGLRSL